MNTIKGVMSDSLKIYAPAKLNLHLDIRERRNDGFHELQSVFVLISLFDVLEIQKTDTGECEIIGMDYIPRQNNLIYSAYNEFMRGTDSPFGCRIACEKNIPSMAGLGGGSSDCAATLKALSLLSDAIGFRKLTEAQMLKAAADLGSDVPFFLWSAAAYAEGRGEILETLNLEKQWTVVLVKPDFDVSTRDAFRWFDEVKKDRRTSLSRTRIIHSFMEESPENWPFFNSFTPVLMDRFPQLGSLLKELRRGGAAFANVSGSGSAVYGVFTDDEKAKITQITLKKSCKNVWKLKMLASAPEAVYN